MVTATAPSGCRRCGRPERLHGTWYTVTGKHTYDPPTQSQIKARMISRRVSGGKVMCCEECPPQITCGSVVCTVRRSLYNYPTMHKNRTDVLHYLFCVIGNGYEWSADGRLLEISYEVYPDAYGLKGVQPDPDGPSWAGKSYMDDTMYAEMKAARDAEQAELKAIRILVDDLARTPGAPLTEEAYGESREYARLYTMPGDAMPDWRAAAEEIRAVVQPVWDARTAKNAAVMAAPALADMFRAAVLELERRGAYATPEPWWGPVAVLLDGEADRLEPMFKTVQREQAKPELLDMVERILNPVTDS